MSAVPLCLRTLSALFIGLFLCAQAAAQRLRIWVADADNGQPIASATVALSAGPSAAAAQTCSTDAGGWCVLEGLRPGYHSCTVTAAGFDTQQLAEVYVAAGKEQLIQVALLRSGAALPLVSITATPPGRRPAQPLGEISLSRDQVLRFPAMYFDPARLAAAHAGVAHTDDGINGMSIRGQGPHMVRWRLEGADVVNPNHLPNAGTFSDRPAAASGGVLMFSAQLLDNSSLLTGALPAGYGDALGGVMDMRLRRGNTQGPEFTVQAGLIGLDVAAEGPFSKKPLRSGRQPASYLANYRYSTVGLLGQMGVSFGDEQINFQDFSFAVGFSGKKGGEWRVFGLGGLSENVFGHKTDSAEVKQYKDFFDIDFASKTGIVGISNWWPLGRRTWLKTALVASGQTNARRSTFRAAPEGLLDSDDLRESKICGTTTLSHRLGERWRLMAGAMLTQHRMSLKTVLASQTGYALQHDFPAIQPWAEFIWRSRGERTTAQMGLHALLQPLPHIQRQQSVQPRLTLTQVLSERHRVSLFVGRLAQISSPWMREGHPHQLLAWQLSARHTWLMAAQWSLRSELYWQRGSGVGVESAALTPFSTFNVPDYGVALSRALIYNGATENRGLEMSAERYLSGGWFALANASLFDSRYQGSDRVWHHSRWSLGHLANLTLGREWLREKSATRSRSFGLNGRAVLSGGYRAMPIDVAASALRATTVFEEGRGFAERQPGYFRLDMRVYWRRGFAERRNSTFAMDLQNVTMQKNVAYRYYDPFTKQVETKYQLGLIPNLSWRLEF